MSTFVLRDQAIESETTRYNIKLKSDKLGEFDNLVRGGLRYMKLSGNGGALFEARKLCFVPCMFGFNCSVPNESKSACKLFYLLL